jgi:hypothetical protein
MSFINLMASDRWSEADIINRTEAMIASEFTPAEMEQIKRYTIGAAIGQYQMSEDEQQLVGRYQAVVLGARQAGIEARADMRLLEQVLEYEAAHNTIAAAGADVIELAALRNPSPEPAPEPGPGQVDPLEPSPQPV